MPEIIELGERCCGCGACAAGCGAGAIEMTLDRWGFLHPIVDAVKCIECGRCGATCPVLLQGDADGIGTVYWAYADEALQMESSSGGVFGALADHVVSAGGVVYGAAFDGSFREVRHIRVDGQECLSLLRGSKYSQSVMEAELYRQIATDVGSGRPVLFSGTACLVAGVRLSLGHLAEAENLLCADVVCHGVPSAGLYAAYIDWVRRQKGADIISVSFRSKRVSWQSYSLEVGFADGTVFSHPYYDDWFMGAYLNNVSLRGSCFTCPSKGSCGSDLTLGDFWCVSKHYPHLADVQGVSAVIVRSEKGRALLGKVRRSLEIGEAEYAHVLQGNPSLEDSAVPNERRDEFLDQFASGRPVGDMMTEWRFYRGFTNRLRMRLLHHLRKEAFWT